MLTGSASFVSHSGNFMSFAISILVLSSLNVAGQGLGARTKTKRSCELERETKGTVVTYKSVSRHHCTAWVIF